jgi:hypothetical protein
LLNAFQVNILNPDLKLPIYVLAISLHSFLSVIQLPDSLRGEIVDQDNFCTCGLTNCFVMLMSDFITPFFRVTVGHGLPMMNGQRTYALTMMGLAVQATVPRSLLIVGYVTRQK